MLHVSQPSVTSHVKALEQELGTRLFERTAAGVRLTPAGDRLLRYAGQVCHLANEAVTDIARLNGEERGRLALGASTTIAQYLLPRLLAQFVQLHPRIELSVVSANTAKIAARVLERESDLGLIEGPPGATELKIEKFVDDRIVVIVPENHPFLQAQNGPPRIAELAAEPLLMREPGSGTRRVVEEALRNRGVHQRDLRIMMELDSTEAIKSGVEAGLGVGFVSRWALRNWGPPSVRAVRVAGLSIKRSFQFIYPHGPEPEGAAGLFLRVARHFRAQFASPLSRSEA